MSETPDRRRRADLDLFILALIESGVSTPYEFQKFAGISQGASVPALRRLVEDGFVRPEKAGSRRRVGHRITAAGRTRLKEDWKYLIHQEPSGDLDADLRVALLAVALGRDRRAAIAYLRRSADRDEVADTILPARTDADPRLAYLYRTLRLRAANSLRRAQSDIIVALAQRLPKTLSLHAPSASRAPRHRKTS